MCVVFLQELDVRDEGRCGLNALYKCIKLPKEKKKYVFSSFICIFVIFVKSHLGIS